VFFVAPRRVFSAGFWGEFDKTRIRGLRKIQASVQSKSTKGIAGQGIFYDALHSERKPGVSRVFPHFEET
jgi:hypothetical protein